jgi:hypothetical protein
MGAARGGKLICGRVRTPIIFHLRNSIGKGQLIVAEFTPGVSGPSVKLYNRCTPARATLNDAAEKAVEEKPTCALTEIGPKPAGNQDNPSQRGQFESIHDHPLNMRPESALFQPVRLPQSN